MPLDTIPGAIRDIAAGRLVIVADDEDRENEGDLVCAADRVTPDLINFMTKFGRGLICVALTPERADALDLPLMTERNSDPQGTAFTVSVDANRRFGVTTGISAHDRAATVRVLADPASAAGDLRRPGHIFPLRARRGGVLRRVGQTEAAVDLARLAGLAPAGVICEILNDDGTMARRDQLTEMARRHGLRFVTVEQLVAHRLLRERLVVRKVEAPLRTRWGDFRAIAYRTEIDDRVHLALVKGDVRSGQGVLVRMHAENPLAEAFGSRDEPGRNQLASALARINREGEGVVVYLRRNRTGERLIERLSTMGERPGGSGGVARGSRRVGAERPAKSAEPTDSGEPGARGPGGGQVLRDYGIGAQILLDLGLTTVRLLTNSRRHIVGLDGYAIRVEGREPLPERPPRGPGTGRPADAGAAEGEARGG